MTTQPTHTPTPWKVAESVAQKDAWYLEGLYNDQWIAIGDDDGTMDFDDAAFIVECVNQHAANENMRRALEDIKALVCGEKTNGWHDQWATTTSRGAIADLCDKALTL